jgi:hypothetical protein
MALKQTIGTGGLYPTGIAPQALDFRATQEGMSQALINQTKQRIQQEKDFMNESEKAILNSLSFEAVQGLSDQVQQNHLKNYNALTDKWTNIYRERGGKLSDFDQLELKKDKMRMDAETANLKSNVEQFRFAQKEILAHPFLYDPESTRRLADITAKGMVGLPESANILVPIKRTPLDYIENIHKPELDRLAKQTDTEISMAKSRQGIVTALKDNERRLGEWYDVKVKENPELFGQISKPDFINALKTNYNTEAFNSSLYSTDRKSSGSKAAKQELYPTNVEGETVFNLPNTMGQAVKRYKVGTVFDAKTGEEVVINDAIDVEPIGFTSNGMIIGEVGGGQLKRGDKPLFSTSTSIDKKPLAEKKKSGKTEDELISNAFGVLSANADKPTKAGQWSNVENVSLTKDEEGNYILRGTITAYEGRFGSDYKPGEKLKPSAKKVESKEVEVPVYPVTDIAGKRQLKFPLKDYRNLVAGQEKFYRIGNKTVGEYLDDIEDGVLQENAQGSVPVLSKAELLNQGYSEEQINSAVKAGKIKLQ